MKILTSLGIAILLICMNGPAYAQIPRTLSYQGVLTDNADKPRQDGDFPFTFRLYDVASGGTALWEEQKSLPVTNGLFSTALGDQVAFGAAIKFDRPYWLGIQVGNDAELAPRIALTSVSYSMNSLRADTARVAMATSIDTTWRHNGSNIYRLNGNIGIGTSNPVSRLDLGTLTGVGIRLNPTGTSFSYNGYQHHNLLIGGYIKNDGRSRNFISFGYTQDPRREFSIGSASDPDFTTASFVPHFTVTSGGNVGIGVGSGAPAFPLHVANNQSGGTYVAGFTKAESGPGYINFLGGNGGGRTYFQFDSDYFGIYTSNNAQTSWHSLSIDGTNGMMSFNGRTKTCVLEITGGCDLAEPFPTSEAESLLPGAVVVIDENNSGHLKLSRDPYDKSVAGIVSGAGGINPGLTLRQEGVMEGEQNIALTGTVYALATAANGPIKPGDRLITSALPGHCMRATDASLCDGAVIGKAMSSLETGEGLVLVLVNLQ